MRHLPSRIAALVVATLALLVGFAPEAHAAPPTADVVTFTYMTDRASAKNAGKAARDWSTGTVADVKKATTCTGPRCISVETIEGYTLCGTDRVACAWWQADGSCLVQVRALAPPDYALALIEHEDGHCLGLPHSDVPTSIMYPGIGPSSRVTDADRAWLNSLLVP